MTIKYEVVYETKVCTRDSSRDLCEDDYMVAKALLGNSHTWYVLLNDVMHEMEKHLSVENVVSEAEESEAEKIIRVSISWNSPCIVNKHIFLSAFKNKIMSYGNQYFEKEIGKGEISMYSYLYFSYSPTFEKMSYTYQGTKLNVSTDYYKIDHDEYSDNDY
jgi:hypothetical protein